MSFSACGYSNKLAFKQIAETDILFVEDFVRNELPRMLSEKCDTLKIDFKESDKKYYFGDFSSHATKFGFTQNERLLLTTAAERLSKRNFEVDPSKENEIIAASKSVKLWFCNELDDERRDETATRGSQNLLSKMTIVSKKNSLRLKQGYRYDDDFKRFCVHNRILSGRMAFNSLHANLLGCFPSISTMNRYIHRSDHAVVEGELRIDELKVYLKERNMPMWVSLSEDATRVDNRLQYDARTNQIIGFVLPTNHNGLPIPFQYKARDVQEILTHFSKDIPIANFVNTIMAKPLGDASAFCLLIFGSNSKYSALDVAKRWSYVSEELEKVGIRVLNISSDSEPKFNSAMRHNSGLGKDSNDSSGLFKCGSSLEPPFYTQDYPHILTKLRNYFLKTIDEPEIIPIGKYFVQQQHLVELMECTDKDQHHLTPSCLNPSDRQNVESALRICSEKVINLLKQEIKFSEGTAAFLQIMQDVYSSFDDRNCSPIERVKKSWRALFMVRIWRNFILNQPELKLADNFMSSYSFYCIEQNAHSLILFLLYLKKNHLTYLFHPYMFSSQPCESFYRQIRSQTTVSSTVVNFSTKEILNRISRTQLLNEISNDKDTGLVYPKTLKSCTFSDSKDWNNFPNGDEIIRTVLKCRTEAINEAINLGLIDEECKAKELACVCPVAPHVAKTRKNEIDFTNAMMFEENEDKYVELHTKLINASLKNYSTKFDGSKTTETSSYVELKGNSRRLVFKKTSVCWFLGKRGFKSSSDRKYRVRSGKKKKCNNKKKCHKNKKSKFNHSSHRALLRKES